MHATWTFLALVAAVAVILLATVSATSPPVLVFVELVEVHGPDGQVYYVNAAEVSSLRQPNAADLGRYFPPGTHCIISTTNGKFIAAREPCSAIYDRLTHHNPP